MFPQNILSQCLLLCCSVYRLLGDGSRTVNGSNIKDKQHAEEKSLSMRQATVIAPSDHAIGLLSSLQYTCAEGESVYCLTLLRLVVIRPVQQVAICPF